MFSSERTGSCFTGAWPILILLGLAAFGGRLTDTILLILLLLSHEAAHLFVAAGFGCDIRRFRLTPLGGIAELGHELASAPGIEAWVALAGPLHHLLLILTAWAVPSFIRALGPHWPFFLRANLSLALFNLLPVHPLDGGRLLRAILATNIGWVKATAVVTRLSRLISWALAAAGLYCIWKNQGPLLLLCALYLLYMGSRQSEYFLAGRMRILADKKGRLSAGEGLKTKILAVRAESSIWPILSRWGSRQYILFCLLDGTGRPLGWRSEEQALSEITRTGLETRFDALLDDRGKEKLHQSSNQDLGKTAIPAINRGPALSCRSRRPVVPADSGTAPRQTRDESIGG